MMMMMMDDWVVLRSGLSPVYNAIGCVNFIS